MSDYTQTTDFSAKDSLSTGDPEKIILGADFDAEFDAISTAIASKYDSTNLANQSQAEAATSNAVLMTPLRLDNWAADNAGMVKDIQALADPGADTLLGWDDSAGAAISYTIGDGLTVTGTTIAADAGASTTIAKPSTTSRSSTTSIADDPHFAGITIAEDNLYIIEGFLRLDCATSGVDFDFDFVFDPATFNGQGVRLYVSTVDEAGNVNTYFFEDGTETTIDIVGGEVVHVTLNGVIFGPSTGGSRTMDFQWAQNASNASPVSIQQGSWLRIQDTGTDWI